jgi:hypothetical protein
MRTVMMRARAVQDKVQHLPYWRVRDIRKIPATMPMMFGAKLANIGESPPFLPI